MLRLTVAFATAAHAADSLALIHRAHLTVREVSPSRGGVGGQMVQLDLEVSASDASRLETLLRGLRGFVVAPPH